MPRRIPIFILLFAVGGPRAASAETLTLSDGGALLTSADQGHWVSHARCVCGEKLTVELDLSALSGGTVELVAGKTCLTSDKRISSSCTSLWAHAVDTLSTSAASVDVSAETLAGSCTSSETTTTIHLLHDATDADQWTSVASTELGVDTKVPATPKAVSVTAGEGLAEVAFSDGSSDSESDTLRFQVLCTTGGAPGLTTPPEAGFDSAEDRCAEGGDAALIAANTCADAVDGTNSVTVQGLTNQKAYEFSVVAIDAAGNPSARRVIGTATPSPEEDFWERYQRSGGQANGQGCSDAGAPGPSATLLLFGLLFFRALRRPARTWPSEHSLPNTRARS